MWLNLSLGQQKEMFGSGFVKSAHRDDSSPLWGSSQRCSGFLGPQLAAATKTAQKAC
jgi:hypothetical protein